MSSPRTGQCKKKQFPGVVIGVDIPTNIMVLFSSGKKKSVLWDGYFQIMSMKYIVK